MIALIEWDVGDRVFNTRIAQTRYIIYYQFKKKHQLATICEDTEQKVIASAAVAAQLSRARTFWKTAQILNRVLVTGNIWVHVWHKRTNTWMAVPTLCHEEYTAE